MKGVKGCGKSEALRCAVAPETWVKGAASS